MSNYQANIITKNPATPTGPNANGSAPGIWRMNEVAYWIKQGVWPNANILSDPYFPYVSLLLSTTSLGNANNNLFVDSSGAFNPISRSGNTTQGSATPYSANWSNYFDGSGDYLVTPSNSALAVGTGDFTLECWINTTAPNNSPVMDSRSTDGGADGFTIKAIGATSIQIFTYANVLTASVPNYAGQWTHLAMVRASGTSTFYVNGVSYGTGYLGDLTNNNVVIGGGRYGGSASITSSFPGYISNFRIVKGTAIYTSNFAPPAAPFTAVSGTQLLTCQSNRFRDASTNNFAITVAGNTSVTDFAPFSPSYPGIAYNQSDITNWSGYFDGSGDYVDFPSTSGLSGSGNFTIQAFIYPTTVAGDCCIYETRGGTGWVWFINSGGYLQVYDSTATLQTASTTQLRANQWTHVALVKNGSTCTYYVNGASAGTFTLSSFAAASRVRIGARYDAAATYFGYISNLRTDTAALTITVPTSNLSAVGTTTLLTLQNAAFTDNSTNNAIATINGNTTVTGNSPFNTVGYWSNYFDGTDDAVVAPNTPANFSSNNFTAECWVMFTTNSIGYQPIMANQGTGDAQGWVMTTETNNRLYFYYSINGSSWAGSIDTGITPTVGVWTHVAVVRNSNTFTFYVNGVASGTSTNSSALHSPSGNFRAGRYLYYPGGARTLTGWISNVRLVNGTAVYTGNFTPSTTPLTAITNTSLLTCQSSRFVDTSANAYSITIEGNPQVQSFDPFYTSTIASNGGSMYFDGSGDYLTVNYSKALAIGSTASWTVEMWFYPTTTLSGVRSLFRTDANGISGIAIVQDGANLYIDCSITGSGWNWSTGPKAITPMQWYHVALVRNGGTMTAYLNGTSYYSAASVNIWDAGTPFYFGAGFSSFYPGYISDARIIKGSAVYTANFTPPTSVLTPSANTVLLVNDMNAGIYDAAAINDMETVGNAQVSTVQSKFGGSSVYFDGTGDYLQIPSSPEFAFGTGDVTLECWLYLNSTSGTQTIAARWAPRGWLWQFTSSTMTVYFGTTGTSFSWSPATSTWYHLAITRSGGSTRFFVNGTQTGSTQTNNGDASAAGIITIGINDDGIQQPINGYIDDFRITKGVARYTANFTPPTQAFPTF